MDSEEGSGREEEGTVNNPSSKQLAAEFSATYFTSDSMQVSLDKDDLNVQYNVEDNIVTGDNSESSFHAACTSVQSNLSAGRRKRKTSLPAVTILWTPQL